MTTTRNLIPQIKGVSRVNETPTQIADRQLNENKYTAITTNPISPRNPGKGTPQQTTIKFKIC